MKKTILSLMFLLASLMMMAQAEVYINPSASDGGNGTIENPLNYIPPVQDNTTYYLKSGESIDLISINLLNKHDVKFTTYGGNQKFKINATGIDKNKTFDCAGTEITIENVEINGNGERTPVQFMSTYYKCDNILINNCKFYNFVSGVRAFGTTNLTVKDCEIYNIGEDGMFISHCDYVTLLNNKVYKTNQLFFTAGTTQKDAPGDGIQLEPVKNWTVIGNHIDRSDTGNKFAFIANNRDLAGVKICRDNTFIGPYDAGDGGAIMYITGAADSVDISGNLFIMSNPNKPISGLWQTVDNANIHNNYFVNVGSSLISNNAIFVNNESCGIDMQLSPYRKLTGEKPKFVGACPDVLLPPEDTTTTEPPVETPPVQDTTGTVEPPVHDTTKPCVSDTVYITTYVNCDTVYIQKQFTIDIISGAFHVYQGKTEVTKKAVNLPNAVQNYLNYFFANPNGNDSLIIQQDPIRIKIQYK